MCMLSPYMYAARRSRKSDVTHRRTGFRAHLRPLMLIGWRPDTSTEVLNLPLHSDVCMAKYLHNLCSRRFVPPGWGQHTLRKFRRQRTCHCPRVEKTYHNPQLSN